MLTLRKAQERGHADHGWLNSYHTFSFANYYDPSHMGFGPLRVINDDTVGPGGGFPPHQHRDMEIISYVLQGALEHKDSMGNGSVIKPGDVQRMSAGTGVTHSEYNASPDEAVHFLQIWLEPAQRGAAAGYEQKYFSPAEKRGRLRLVVSPDGEQGSLRIGQNARIYASLLGPGDVLEQPLAAGRKGWLHVARGAAVLNGTELQAGDGAAITGEPQLTLSAASEAEILFFDLPA